MFHWLHQYTFYLELYRAHFVKNLEDLLLSIPCVDIVKLPYNTVGLMLRKPDSTKPVLHIKSPLVVDDYMKHLQYITLNDKQEKAWAINQSRKKSQKVSDADREFDSDTDLYPDTYHENMQTRQRTEDATDDVTSLATGVRRVLDFLPVPAARCLGRYFGVHMIILQNMLYIVRPVNFRKRHVKLCPSNLSDPRNNWPILSPKFWTRSRTRAQWSTR